MTDTSGENIGFNFRTSVLGYSKSDVNEYITRLTSEHDRESTELRKRFSEAMRSADEKYKKYHALYGKIADMKQKLGEYERTAPKGENLNELLKSLDEARADAGAIRNELNASRSYIQQLQTGLAGSKNENAVLRERLEEAELKIRSLQEPAAVSGGFTVNRNSTAQFYESQGIDELEAKNAELVVENHDMKRRMEDLAARLKESEENATRLVGENAVLSDRLETMSAGALRDPADDETIIELTRKTESQELLIADQKKLIEELTAQNLDLNSGRGEAFEEMHRIKDENEVLSARLSAMSAENESLKMGGAKAAASEILRDAMPAGGVGNSGLLSDVIVDAYRIIDKAREEAGDITARLNTCRTRTRSEMTRVKALLLEVTRAVDSSSEGLESILDILQDEPCDNSK